MYKQPSSCHCFAFFTVLLWSSAYVFTKIAMQHFTAPALGFLRCAIAAAILTILLFIRKAALPKAIDIPWLILSGVTGFAAYLLVFNKGSGFLSPTTSCILISTSPIISAVMARCLFAEKLTKSGWAAILLAFSGVVLLMVWDGPIVASREGIFWMLCAAVSISLYNILQRKLSRDYTAFQVTAYSFLAGTALLAWGIPQAAAEVQSATLPQLGTVVFLGVFPSALAYLFWARALALAPNTSSVTNFMYLTPLLALVLEYLIMARLPGPGTFIGGSIILASLILFAKTGREKQRN